MKLHDQLDKAIREIPDFPKPGILFKDITPVLLDPKLCKAICEAFENQFPKGSVDAIVGVESRGFLFGPLLAQYMAVPFVLARKAGKLPGDTIQYSFELEYGRATLEIHKNVIQSGWRVLIHDDLLATGGTAKAASQLVKMEGGEIAGFGFLVELDFLKGRDKIFSDSQEIFSILHY